MSVAIGSGVAEPSDSSLRIDWVLVSCIAASGLMILAASEAGLTLDLAPHLTVVQARAIGHVAFAFALVLPVIVCWRRAVRDSQMPARLGDAPHYEHVNGWGAIFLVIVVGAIAALVWWAAQSDDVNRKIHAEWGFWVVVGLTATFLAVASAPLLTAVLRQLRLEQGAIDFASALNAPAEWLGKCLSVVDGFLVFAVAPAAGAHLKSVWLRYGVLISTIGACAVLGYYWDAPIAFIPLAWAFIAAFSIARRWSWIEQDRELAMLNPSISHAHIRVGFEQDLRDEALAAFLSMFLLVPLALRQAQLLAQASGVDLFTLTEGADVHSMNVWISFYGTELAKAVPFVDWAEIYHVEGNALVSATSAWSQHVVFLTRVMVDLVFLAALLQAISSASRDAQQKDLFYRKQSINRLDPFTEPEALRALVARDTNGLWVKNQERFDEFPRRYDTNRLFELRAHKDERIGRAADFLLERENIGLDPNHILSARAAEKDITPEEINTLINNIETAGGLPNVYQLALARRRLLTRRDMIPHRTRLLSMIAAIKHESPERRERTVRLIEALVGEYREPYQRARMVALEALAPDTGVNLLVRTAVRQAADHDGAQAVRKRARDFLIEHPETPD